MDALDELQKLRNDTSQIVKRKDDDLVETKKALAILKKMYIEKRNELSNIESKLQNYGVTQAKIRKLNKNITYRNRKINEQKETINSMKKPFNDSQPEKNELHTQIKYVERKLTVAVNKLESVNKDDNTYIARRKTFNSEKIIVSKEKTDGYTIS